MNEKQIKKDYMSGMTYKDIQEKHNITKNKLIYLIQKNNWKRESNRSKVQKGNKNAKNNKGGAPEKNKNALTTGEYENIFSSVLDDDEIDILGKTIGTREMILGELNILTVREKRMMRRILELKAKQKDMVVTRMKKDNENTTTEVQNTLFLINKIEDGLTRVQQSKKKMLDLLYKIEIDDGKIVENSNETEFERNTGLLDSINRQLLGGGKNA